MRLPDAVHRSQDDNLCVLCITDRSQYVVESSTKSQHQWQHMYQATHSYADFISGARVDFLLIIIDTRCQHQRTKNGKASKHKFTMERNNNNNNIDFYLAHTHEIHINVLYNTNKHKTNK